MVTIGGWLTEKLGDIPKIGDRLIVEPLLFHILAADEKAVQKVYIRKLPTRGES
jgi:CBS domain containing-hemolysin-like protein